MASVSETSVALMVVQSFHARIEREESLEHGRQIEQPQPFTRR
jgi:hypothetical protein